MSNYESPESQDKSVEKKEELLYHYVEVRIRNHLKRAHLKNPDKSDREIYAYALGGLAHNMAQVYPEKLAEIKTIIDDIFNNHLDVAEEELIAHVSEKLSKYLAVNFTAQELEEIDRKESLSREHVELNHLITYIHHKDENFISLHVPLTAVDNPLELRKLFIDALKRLAEKLKTDPELITVQKIKGKSWIVAKSHKGFEKLGFTITNLDIKNNTGEMEISKEDLIRLYG